MFRRTFCKAVVAAAVAVVGLTALSGDLFAQGRDEGLERAIAAQEKHTERLMVIKGVEGTAVGLDRGGLLAVKIFTDGSGVAGLPKSLDGFPVEVVVAGKFNAIKGPPPGKGPKEPKEEVDPTARFTRPVPIGVSAGSELECSAGTIGCMVTDARDVYVLSNKHVLAPESMLNPLNTMALQPGRYDVDPQCVIDPLDSIGIVCAFEPITFSTSASNRIDAAIAISSTLDLDVATPSDGYGVPKSTTLGSDEALGKAVQKYGRTTSLTKGTVAAMNWTGNIGYSSGSARFVNQIIVYSAKGPLLKPGDSGSLVVTKSDNPDEDRQPVGLLFAGNSSGKYGIANPIDAVLIEFGVVIVGE